MRAYPQMPRSQPGRRDIYRNVKKNLRRALRRSWTGTSSTLNRALQRLLRGRSRSDLLILARRPVLVGLLLAGVTVSGGSAHTDSIQLSDVALGSGGFAMHGESSGDHSGRSVSGAGDVNGDGLADLIVGAPYGTEGISYVVFGKSDGTAVQLSDVALGAGGFALHGSMDYYGGELSGWSVSGAGDVNGDGLADLVVGAPRNGRDTGRSYVVFGKSDGTAVQLSDVALDAGGFALHGAAQYDYSGHSVSGAGDVNGDGLADVIVGAFGADPNGRMSGTSYVVFGKSDGTAVQLSDVALGTGGFTMHGAAMHDFAGISVSGAGDVNGDGLADLIVGAHYADPNGGYSGTSYVVFGKADGAAVQLLDVAAGTGGFAMHGATSDDNSGFSVSGSGDVNGDGLADLIVGAFAADPNGGHSGTSYVVFGKADSAAVELSDVAGGTGGFAMHGAITADDSGWSVSGAGDVNGDGLADVIVGARRADPYATDDPYPIDDPGASYVVFGKSDGTAVELSDVALGNGGFAMHGAAMRDYAGFSVSGAGDVNGDGLADVIVGALQADPNGWNSGTSYVVFSNEIPEPASMYLGYSLPGAGPGGIVPETVFEDARMKIDFSDEDFGDDGNGGSSLEMATLYRSRYGISNLVGAGLATFAADVAWQMLTDRVNWTDALVTLKYTDAELDPLQSVENHLRVYTAAQPDGPWTELSATRDADRNELAVTVDPSLNPRYFAIGWATNVLWVNFGYAGAKIGTRPQPFDTLKEAIDAVASEDTIIIDGASAVKSSPGPITISKPMTIRAADGTITIGSP